MYEKINKSYKISNNGKFFDLGCGVGQLVYTAAMINEDKFITCGGIEIISNLLDRGVKRLLRFNNTIKQNFPTNVKNMKFIWSNDNLFKNDVWHDSSFLIIHWTAFSNKQVKELSDLLSVCKEGTQIITITHPIHNIHNDYLLLIKDQCIVSWGDADFYVYEKITASHII